MRRKSPARPRARQQLPKKRVAAIKERNQAIVDAALDEFTRHGFAGARMDDIARRAGVAKGTIYLRFRDKQALFEAIIQHEIAPLLDAVGHALEPGESVRAFLERTLGALVSGPGRERRTAVIRLLIAEAGRFPKLAETYFRTVVDPGMQIFSRLARQALKSGELASAAPVEFPQLLIAPAILALLWSALFARFQPLDIEAMLRAYLDQVFAPAQPARKQRRSN